MAALPFRLGLKMRSTAVVSTTEQTPTSKYPISIRVSQQADMKPQPSDSGTTWNDMKAGPLNSKGRPCSRIASYASIALLRRLLFLASQSNPSVLRRQPDTKHYDPPSAFEASHLAVLRDALRP
ncbi:hypothetical protein CKAH01_01031 [Colletotrichum kahawae]|uniref:Uncharacterized protein n=1 Tax=Colletotrichum kahawae TaxID=34407 RepID=A0AAE0D535_COLKA|nr:hypothetical protein CKAH01_01031 [Colletotrichum kahawae]